jgi:hypothetical protein
VGHPEAGQKTLFLWEPFHKIAGFIVTFAGPHFLNRGASFFLRATANAGPELPVNQFSISRKPLILNLFLNVFTVLS